MRTLLKRPLERALSSAWIGSVTRQRVRGKRLILAYHGVVPDGERVAGERSLFITQREFAAHLDLLSEVADVAPLNKLDEDGDGRPRVAITIDDAYLGAVRQGVDELAKRSLPATIFVAPARLGGHVFWWDALSSERGEMDPALRTFALSSLAGSDEKVRSWAAAAALPKTDDLPEYARSAAREDLRVAVRKPGITLGSHSLTHRNLSRLDIQEVMSEVGRSRLTLKAEFGARAIDWLAYPYGLDSVAAQQAVAASSYKGAVLISGGWHNPARTPAFARPRLNIPAGLSVERLRIHVLGGLLS